MREMTHKNTQSRLTSGMSIHKRNCRTKMRKPKLDTFPAFIGKLGTILAILFWWISLDNENAIHGTGWHRLSANNNNTPTSNMSCFSSLTVESGSKLSFEAAAGQFTTLCHRPYLNQTGQCHLFIAFIWRELRCHTIKVEFFHICFCFFCDGNGMDVAIFIIPITRALKISDNRARWC